MDSIIIESNAGGFFSNCNIMLSRIIAYFNAYKKAPVEIKTINLFSIYNSNRSQDIYKSIFYADLTDLEYTKEVKFNDEGFENQFSDYKALNLNDIQPFITKYFKPALLF